MKQVSKKNQIRKYMGWIWQDQNVALCNNCSGYAYSVCVMDENGCATKQLTPSYKTTAELLAYLQGVHAVKSQAT